MATAHMFIDYQNLHMSAHEQFARFHEPVYQSLVHPAKFADRVAEPDPVSRTVLVC